MNYILETIDYVSKLVDEIVLPNYESKSVKSFLQKNILSTFMTHIVITSDGEAIFEIIYLKSFLRNTL